MTRINAGINPKYLTNEHLLAEHREIKRICNLYYLRCLKKKEGRKLSDIPTEFTLGKGHVLFFIDKPVFTYQRYTAIHLECLERKMDVTDFRKLWDVYFKGEFKMNFPTRRKNPMEFPTEYLPAKAHKDLVTKRVILRIKYGKLDNYHYTRTNNFSKILTREEAIELLLG